MNRKHLNRILNGLVGLVWLINGLICKVLNLVPRHQQIVGRILGNDNAHVFAVLIGFSETLMAIWIFSGFKSRLNAIAQIVVVALMNTLEFILVPDLLLWGRLNAFFAFLFILVVYYNEFSSRGKKVTQS